MTWIPAVIFRDIIGCSIGGINSTLFMNDLKIFYIPKEPSAFIENDKIKTFWDWEP